MATYGRSISSQSAGDTKKNRQPSSKVPLPKTKRTKKRKKKSKAKKFFKIALFLLLGIFLFGVLVLGIFVAITPIPTPQELAASQDSTVFYSDGESVLGELKAENKDLIKCEDLPDYVKNAVVASEDRSFYSNLGIDPFGIARAFFKNATTGSKQGGSSITQQYAERYYMGSATTYADKFKEALLSIKIAVTQPKEEILCNYLNTIYFGRGTFGIQAGAKAFYGVDAKKMTIAQAALIAGIIPAPSAWDPVIDKEMAVARFERVIEIMKDDGYITATEASEAQFPKTVKPKNNTNMSGTKGYLLDMVKKELMDSANYTESELLQGGLKIYSTVDKPKQKAMINAIKTLPSDAPAGLEVGGISLDPATGGVLAGYGGPDFTEKEFNNMTQGTAQAGSTFKAFALLGAIQQGISLKTKFNGDSPQSFPGIPEPRINYGNTSYGMRDLYDATAFSINTCFFNLVRMIGSETVAKNAVLAGIGLEESEIDNVGILDVIGIASVSPQQLATAYNTFASGGKVMTTHIIKEVRNKKDEIQYYFVDNSMQVFSEEQIAALTDALKAPTTYGFSKQLQNLNRPVAGKSGTTDRNKSAWFAGFIPQITATFGIWLPDENGGNADIPNFSNGGNVGSGWTANAFDEYMLEACKDLEVLQFPKPPVQPSPSNEPSSTPSAKPSKSPSAKPSEPAVSPSPSVEPTVEPSETPTIIPATPEDPVISPVETLKPEKNDA